MSWYSARLLYESVHDPPDQKPHPLFEESIVVFKAADRESIPAKLDELAHSGEVDYEAIAGNRVHWTFREVLEVQEISGRDRRGTEVFYRWWHKPGPRAFQIIRETHDSLGGQRSRRIPEITSRAVIKDRSGALGWK